MTILRRRPEGSLQIPYIAIKWLNKEASWMDRKLLECRALSDHAPVAQLDRVPGYELGGREFESLRAHQ